MRMIGLIACATLILGNFACSKSSSTSSTPTTNSSDTAAAPANSGPIKIAVIPKGTSHIFWRTVDAGANKAATELGVQIVWKGPLREDDRSDQIKLVQQFVSDGISGIVIAPLDREALRQPIADAMAQKIPVVIFDSALDGTVGKDFVSFVATNNKQGGKMAGEELVKLLGGKGKVVLLRYAVGSASTEEREAGFLEVMKATPGIEVTVDNRYGGASVATAQDEAMKLIDKLKEADGVFCPNESSTLGMLGALKANNLNGKIKFVGFDATPALVDALKAGDCQALVAQDPGRMGYLGVKTCVAVIKGEKVEPLVDTGVRLITADDLTNPEIRKFLNLE